MLYTITAHLLAETTAYYDGFRTGQTQRARREEFQVGGKGINVSRMATKLQWPTEALCFPGGHLGDRSMHWLRQQPFAVRAFAQSSETRAGWVVRVEGLPETTFLGCDQPLEAPALNQAVDYLLTVLRPGDVISLSGSVPGWNSSLADACERLRRELPPGCLMACDTYGPPLRWAAGHDLLLIKINFQELRGLVGAITRAQLPAALVRLRQSFPLPQNWVISDGPRAVLAIDRDGVIHRAIPEKITESSPVGSGDVLMAGLLYSLHRGQALRDALAFSLPLATANARRPDVAGFDPAEVAPLADHQIRRLHSPQARKDALRPDRVNDR